MIKSDDVLSINYLLRSDTVLYCSLNTRWVDAAHALYVSRKVAALLLRNVYGPCEGEFQAPRFNVQRDMWLPCFLPRLPLPPAVKQPQPLKPPTHTDVFFLSCGVSHSVTCVRARFRQHFFAYYVPYIKTKPVSCYKQASFSTSKMEHRRH